MYVPIHYLVNSESCLSGIASIPDCVIWDRVHSEFCPFGMAFIRDLVHFGMVLIQDRVHSDDCSDAHFKK